MSKRSLRFEHWLAPLDIAEFRGDGFGHTPLFVHPRPELARDVLNTLAINSLDDVFALRGVKAYAWFPMRDGRHAAAPIPAASGKRLHEGGIAIYLRRVREFESFDREAAENLRIPASSVECSLFCNPANALTRAHFDRADLFILQLKGRKRWQIAPNTFAPNPIHSWGTLDRVPPDVRIYASGIAPTAMPEESSTYVLEPGAILYLPRGYWHETVSEEDALSLHVTVSSTTRMDVMLDALRNELVRDPWWRGPGYTLSAGEPRMLEQAALACAALSEAASRIDQRDIIHLPVRTTNAKAGDRFSRCGQVSYGIEALDTHSETARVVITTYTYRERKAVQLELSIEFVAACDWINSLVTGTVFDVAALLRVAPGLNETEARELLGVLEGARLVRRVD